MLPRRFKSRVQVLTLLSLPEVRSVLISFSSILEIEVITELWPKTSRIRTPVIPGSTGGGSLWGLSL